MGRIDPRGQSLNVLAVAGDAGGARALLPVIESLLSRPDVAVECRAYAAASAIWDAAGLQAVAAATLWSSHFDRLLVGTSYGGERWELDYIKQASKRGVMSLAVVDSWVNYRERFESSVRELVLPDVITAIDASSRDAMVAAGLPFDRIVITGQPALDELMALRQVSPFEVRSKVRLLAGSTAGELILVYVSQPLSQFMSRERLGYDEHEVLHDLVAASENVMVNRSCRGAFLIKLHPREQGLSQPPRSSSRLAIEMVEDADLSRHELVIGADLVLGMNSMLLMEALLLRKGVISYQPGLRIADSLPANNLGWSRAVYRRRDLVSALDEELFHPAVLEERSRRLAAIEPPRGATERVVRLLVAGNNHA